MRNHSIHKTSQTALLAASLALAAIFLCATSHLAAQTPRAQAGPPQSFYEFGTVVSLNQRTIDIQTFNQQKQRTVQYSFALSRETKADVVHVGDSVEVIYEPTGADWTIRRLILLAAGIPKAGPPADDRREVPKAVDARILPPASGAHVPAATSVTHSAAAPGASSTATTRSVTVPAGTTGSARPGTAASVDLPTAPRPKPTQVIDTSLAGSDLAAKPRPITTKDVAFEVPRAECNRDSADWPSQPLRLAVLDFRYPTEREEAHDVGTTGGGSGTAVADLIYNRLDQLNEFAMSRGDRTRLYRADFAGAARVGRELGVDAVLAGTFKPMDPPPGSDPDFPPAKTYELSAGIVDTCTGQLLERLISVQCPAGLDPNAAANAASCKPFSVTAKQATDPKEQSHAFKSPIDALLYPLEHDGPPPGTEGSAGVVTAINAAAVTIKLPAGTSLKAGDQVALHAWRLTKNPTTYTLHNLHDEEIGRVTLTSVKAGIATGTFTGDFPPHTGDTAELISN